MAVEVAKAMARASSTMARTSGRRWRDRLLAVMPASRPVNGRRTLAKTERPGPSSRSATRQVASAAPIHSSAGPAKAQ